MHSIMHSPTIAVTLQSHFMLSLHEIINELLLIIHEVCKGADKKNSDVFSMYKTDVPDAFIL